MRFLVRLDPGASPREKVVEELRSIGRSVGGEVRNPKWTSKGHLEIDIFAPARTDFDLFLAAAEPLARIDHFRDLNDAPKFREKEDLIKEAREFFDAERYWEAHEDLETVWRNLSGQEKLFVQGLILVCAAFVHHQKGEEAVALGVLRRASAQLDHPAGFYFGINVSHLRSAVSNILTSREFHVFEI